MINQIYQPNQSPGFINVKYQEEAINQENHITHPPHIWRSVMWISRLLSRKRDPKILNKNFNGNDSRVMWNQLFLT